MPSSHSSDASASDPLFVRIGLDPAADEDELYTVEILMDRVGYKLYGDSYWKKSSQQEERGQSTNIDRDQSTL